MEPLSIYIHIPFCVKKCLYCDFPSWSGLEGSYEGYVENIVKEIKKAAPKYSHKKVQSIFIGGGTPTVLPSKLLGKIMDAVFSSYDMDSNAEITCEANPGTLDIKKLIEMKSMDINRLSMGLQAWQSTLLARLGRIHTSEKFVENYMDALAVGFENINVDIMFALPGQSLADWKETLLKVTDLRPKHISAYSLIIEDGTPFKKLYSDGVFLPTDEELDREMYYTAKDILTEKGYHRYEISNFAMDSFESRHNKVYWSTGEYVGFGLGAHSFDGENRFHNTYDFKKYFAAKGEAAKLTEELEKLSLEEKMAEFMFMGLRMTKGISKNDFYSRFKTDIKSVYGDVINELIYDRLLNTDTNAAKNDTRWYLTDKGIDISNFVFEKFLL